VAQQRSDDTAPSVLRLRAHVQHLASDKLEGRRTGDEGARLAAEYIAGEFSRYGLKRSIGRDLPGMSRLEADSPRRYMQEFPFIAGVELGKNNTMLFTPGGSIEPRGKSLDLRIGEDWMPLGFSSNARLEFQEAIFVGYGIKADELNHDDYNNVPVRDRIAIAFAGTPDGDNPHGALARYAGVRWKAIAARNAGASALVVIAHEDNFRTEPLRRLQYDNSGGEAGLPVVVISRQAAARILEAGGLSPLPELEKAARAAAPAINAGSTMQTAAEKTSVEKPKSAGAMLQKVALSVTTDIVRRNAPAYNVVGILEGSDPVLKNEVIVIGAHYDHLGRGGEGSLSEIEGEVHHGADDNASGVGGMLELARIFTKERASIKRTLVFIAFGGEEEGLLGSNYYVNHPLVPNTRMVAMINMDMIGRMKDNRLMIGGVGTAAEWRDLIKGAQDYISGPRSRVYGKGEKIVIGDVFLSPFTLTLNEDGYGPSDHSSFYSKQVPVLFFFTGTHEDYHKPSDTAEKINYADEARILSFVASIVRALNESAKAPTYTVARSPATGRTMGFRVYLGTIPSYAESNDGLRLDGVRDDSPAAKAGLKAGDRITRMAGREVRNVYDYTYVLGEMKAGQEYDVEVVRGTETLKLKLTPAARK
jgi:hypothetical protein